MLSRFQIKANARQELEHQQKQKKFNQYLECKNEQIEDQSRQVQIIFKNKRSITEVK